MYPNHYPRRDRIIAGACGAGRCAGPEAIESRAPRSYPPARPARAPTGMLAALLLLIVAGCCGPSGSVAPYVAVREAQFRTEQSAGDRIALPLDTAARDRVLKFLRAGGNTRSYDTGVVDPGADQRDAGLLDWLAVDRTLDDLSSSELKRWFTAGPVFQVVDARERYALSDTQVAAMSDGSYWWIFYHPRSKHLDQLLVTPVVGAKPAGE